jgi:hypothetical protein
LFFLIYFSRNLKISKDSVPNLRRLKIKWDNDIGDVEPLDQFFGHDVLFSLTNFTLLGSVNGPEVVHNLLSILCHQCSYILMVNWNVETIISLSDTSTILLDIFRQLQSRLPIELQLSVYQRGYSITVSTIPQVKRCLYTSEYLSKIHVYAYVDVSNFLFYKKCCFS